jgi:hypothetical protein
LLILGLRISASQARPQIGVSGFAQAVRLHWHPNATRKSIFRATHSLGISRHSTVWHRTSCAYLRANCRSSRICGRGEGATSNRAPCRNIRIRFNTARDSNPLSRFL